MFAANPRLSQLRQYRLTYRHQSGKITDVFDSKCYRHLHTKHIQIGDETLPSKYFSDDRDVALGLSMDGFSPFKQCKQTAWPLILFDYNLPPEIRFHLKHILSLGIIPGPKKPKDMDSYLWPLVQELLRLAKGVAAFDVLSKTHFALRAFLILAFGDIPAVSMLMRMKGHNGYSPCRMCEITGLRIPHSSSTTHYVPLDRSTHPDIINDCNAIKSYDPRNLPLHTHDWFMTQAEEVDATMTNVDADHLSWKYGIKGHPILSHLHSLHFPLSFPYDFMHLIWENLLKNLILHWTGAFKGLDNGKESYQLMATVWKAIGETTGKSGNFIPSAYGVHLPNIAADGVSISAEMWSFWTTHLGPVYLRHQFTNEKYYDHFVRLVQMLNVCLQFEISDEEIRALEDGFICWVKEYKE